MTDTLIAIISIFSGIIGGNATRFIFKKKYFDTIGNTIAGVFGSVFFIKSFGHFGFDPKSIMQSGSVNFKLFIINLIVSFIGAIIAVILLNQINTKINSNS